jgi:hypothetical protein
VGAFLFGARRLPCRRSVGLKVVVVGGGQHISGVGKRRHPGVVFQHGVPSDVIGVDVGVHHHVHGVAVDARRLQRSQEPGVQVIQGWHMGALAVVTDAGVHEDGQPVDLDHPALHRDAPLIGIGVEEVRHQQIGVVPPFRSRRSGEEPGSQLELKLHYARDDRVTNPHLVHHMGLARR